MPTWVPSALRADVRFIVQNVILPKRAQGANMYIFAAFDMIVAGHARKMQYHSATNTNYMALHLHNFAYS